MVDFIPVNEPLLGEKEKEYVNDCLDTNWISSEGSYVTRFEEAFSKSIRRKHAITVCNGSMALEAAVKALGIGKGDEVIIPTFTIISCASAVVRAGAVPIVVDCDPNTLNMNVNLLRDKITDRTRAIMAVHIYGLPVDMNPLLDIAKEFNLFVIEDAAEAIGQTYNNKPCGCFGDISVFSFYPNKLVTTGEGGLIATNKQDIANKCKSLRNLYFDNNHRFIHEELGWNLRMTNIQAAIGLAQLEKLDVHIKRKIETGEYYNQLLSDIDSLILPVAKTEYADNIYWIYGLLLKNSTEINAHEIMKKLKNRNIGSRPFFYPIHQQPVFKKMGLFDNTKCPVAELLYDRGFYIPSGLGISNKQIKTVSNALHDILQ